MTPDKYAGLLAAIIGAIGTGILFFNSWALQPFAGGIFGSDEITKHNEEVRACNARRLIWQRIGFALLCLGFSVQGASYFL